MSTAKQSFSLWEDIFNFASCYLFFWDVFCTLSFQFCFCVILGSHLTQGSYKFSYSYLTTLFLHFSLLFLPKLEGFIVPFLVLFTFVYFWNSQILTTLSINKSWFLRECVVVYWLRWTLDGGKKVMISWYQIPLCTCGHWKVECWGPTA